MAGTIQSEVGMQLLAGWSDLFSLLVILIYVRHGGFLITIYRKKVTTG